MRFWIQRSEITPKGTTPKVAYRSLTPSSTHPGHLCRFVDPQALVEQLSYSVAIGTVVRKIDAWITGLPYIARCIPIGDMVQWSVDPSAMAGCSALIVDHLVPNEALKLTQSTKGTNQCSRHRRQTPRRCSANTDHCQPPMPSCNSDLKDDRDAM